MTTNVRNSILEEMKANSLRGIDCKACIGTCCTFSMNSMQITPLEAYELTQYLHINDLFNDKLINKLEACIKEFRLDHDFQFSTIKQIRRTYTCPFYTPGPTGCSLSFDVKPYGCLAFNPSQKDANTGIGCKSNIEFLEQLSQQEFIFRQNQKIAKELKLDWKKRPIPIAVLACYQSLKNLNFPDYTNILA